MTIAFERVSTWDPRFVAAIREHYTRSRGAPPGKKMAWRVSVGDVTIAWLGAGEPPFKLAPRRKLGISDARPLPCTVANFIFRVVKHGVVPASAILKAWHPVLERDWSAEYGWAPEHIETMVDPSEVGGDNEAHVAGYCFRRAGYRALGMTTGRGARRPAGHRTGPRVWSDGSPKLVLYRGPLPRVP